MFNVGMRNVEKYPHATHVEIVIAFEASRVHLTIVDDGVGFVVPKNFDDMVMAGKLSLVGLKERAVLIGGTVEVKAAPGHGTKISVVIPA